MKMRKNQLNPVRGFLRLELRIRPKPYSHIFHGSTAHVRTLKCLTIDLIFNTQSIVSTMFYDQMFPFFLAPDLLGYICLRNWSSLIMSVQLKVWAETCERWGRHDTHCPRTSSFVPLMGVKLSLLEDTEVSWLCCTNGREEVFC